MEIFQSYDHKCTATFLWFTVYCYYACTEQSNRALLHAENVCIYNLGHDYTIGTPYTRRAEGL